MMAYCALALKQNNVFQQKSAKNHDSIQYRLENVKINGWTDKLQNVLNNWIGILQFSTIFLGKRHVTCWITKRQRPRLPGANLLPDIQPWSYCHYWGVDGIFLFSHVFLFHSPFLWIWCWWSEGGLREEVPPKRMEYCDWRAFQKAYVHTDYI